MTYKNPQRHKSQIWLVVLSLTGCQSVPDPASRTAALPDRPGFAHAVELETSSETSANVSIGDLDDDGHLDLVLVKGRHWPLVNRILFGDGTGRFPRSADLGEVADRSYSGSLADLDGDGDLDIVISNDKPDPGRTYINDGRGHFREGSQYGRPEWNTRNASVADLNGDGAPDIVVANRSREPANHVCLNDGRGRFDDRCRAFSHESSTTITASDLDDDGRIDLVVPNRDGGQGHVYFATAPGDFPISARVPFGPADAQMRVSAVADLDGDGNADIVAIHNDSAAIYPGNGDSFEDGISLFGDERAPYALAVADVNADSRPDLIVGYVEAPSSIFFNEGGFRFDERRFGDSEGAVYGFAIADINDDGQVDIAAARSDAPNTLYLGTMDDIPAIERP